MIVSEHGTATDKATADFWSGRSVFVTGASGIVGSWLALELVRELLPSTTDNRDEILI